MLFIPAHPRPSPCIPGWRPQGWPWPALLLAPALALPAVAQGATATLLNRTGQVWKVQADPMAPPRIPVRLTVTVPGAGIPAASLDVPGTAPVAVDLPPGAALAITHFEPAGGDVRRFLDLRTEPGPDLPGPWPVEACLCLRTAPAWILWGPDRTVLSGLVYADGAVPRFRFSPGGDGTLHLERLPEPAPAPGCLISRRPFRPSLREGAGPTGPWPCRSPWPPAPAAPPGPPGAAG